MTFIKYSTIQLGTLENDEGWPVETKDEAATETVVGALPDSDKDTLKNN